MWVTEKGREPGLHEIIDPATTALILIDIQNDFCHPDGAFASVGHDNSRMVALAERVKALLAEARRHRMLIVFIRATYDEPVTSAPLARHRNRLGLKNSLCLEGSWGAEWYAGVEPLDAPNEIVITKHRFDAFQGTSLDLVLRSNGITSTIITGVVSSGCVESTVRASFFRDYYVVVPQDCCNEADPDHHENAMAVIDRSFGVVTSADTLIGHWQALNAETRPAWDRKLEGSTSPDPDGRRALLLINFTERARGVDDATLAAARRWLDRYREAGDMVIHIAHSDTPLTVTMASAEPPNGPSPAWLEGLGPNDGELVVTKHRTSAFSDTRLNLLLRTNLVRHVTVIGGDGPLDVESTVRSALDEDFRVTIAPDAVFSGDAKDDDPGPWFANSQRLGAQLSSLESQTG